jgi:hypothetical protein
MRDALQAYVKRVQDLAEHVRGNEQANKQSLIRPLFTLLGYDLTDPPECVPEARSKAMEELESEGSGKGAFGVLNENDSVVA